MDWWIGGLVRFDVVCFCCSGEGRGGVRVDGRKEGATDEDAPRRQQAQEYGAVRSSGKPTSEDTRIDHSVPERHSATGGINGESW